MPVGLPVSQARHAPILASLRSRVFEECQALRGFAARAEPHVARMVRVRILAARQRQRLQNLARYDRGDAVRFRRARVAPADVPRWLRACERGLPGLRARGLRPGGDRGAGLRPARRGRARGLLVATAVSEGGTGALCDPDDVAGMAAALVRASALEPGVTARAAAEPYSLACETARAVAVLERCGR